MDDIINLGPTFLHSMMPFERMNGVIKGFIHKMSRLDGSIAQGYLTKECISFCESYLTKDHVVVCPSTSTVEGSKAKVTPTVIGM